MNLPRNPPNPHEPNQPGPKNRNTPMDPTTHHAGRPADHPDDERVAAQFTAYALGELAEDDARAVEILLADPARTGERDALPELRSLAAALRQAVNADHDAPSAELRRAVVATLAVSPPVTVRRHAAGHATSRRRTPFRWLSLVGGLAAAASVAVVVTSSWLMVAPRLDVRDGRVVHDAPVTDLAVERVIQESDGGAANAHLETLANAHLEARAMPRMAMPEPAARAADRDFGRPRAVNGIAPSAGLPPAGVTERQSRDRFGQFAENRFRQVAEAPLSTFSVDVDTASYALVRRFLTAGRLPPREAVRIEELVNYFRYATPRPEGDEPFAVSVEAAACPWRPGHRLVRIAVAARDVEHAVRPAGNIVFLVDVSGSMGPPDRLPLVKQALAMLVEELGENDHVAIVTYAGDAGLRLPPTNGTEKATILAAIESLTAGGSTHGSAGITLAYEQAAERFIPGGANRVILATDGDLNVGVTSDDELVELIRRQAAGGTFLTVLGVGTGNLQDEKLEKLAAHGNGVYAYLDSLREARKVLVEQLTGSTITVAKDVKIQVEFNPAVVASWRLIGYENRVLAARDFRDDTKDAGDIGAGHHVTALYEVALVGEADDQAGGEPLKYAPVDPAADATAVQRPADTSAELLTVKLRFKQPEGSASVLREVPLADRGGEFAAASADFRFAAAVAGFGIILRGSEFRGSATLPWVARTAAAALGDDRGGWRTEFLDLVRRAETLSGRVRPARPEASPEP
jgi:Ca-activated chloride channel family protein